MTVHSLQPLCCHVFRSISNFSFFDDSSGIRTQHHEVRKFPEQRQRADLEKKLNLDRSCCNNHIADGVSTFFSPDIAFMSSFFCFFFLYFISCNQLQDLKCSFTRVIFTVHHLVWTVPSAIRHNKWCLKDCWGILSNIGYLYGYIIAIAESKHS